VYTAPPEDSHRAAYGTWPPAEPLSYDAKVFAKTDLYHSFPTMIDKWIRSGGTIGKQASGYVEYPHARLH